MLSHQIESRPSTQILHDNPQFRALTNVLEYQETEIQFSILIYVIFTTDHIVSP